MNTFTQLSNDQIKKLAPSVFAEQPWENQSDKYRFIPSINVVNALRDAGYSPVKAFQSNSRIPGKKEFTKHMLRFRRNDFTPSNIGEVIPEIILVNSHDGTSSYKLMLGLYRLVCMNGLTVADAEIENIRFRHSGRRDLCQEVIDISARLISETPKTLETVSRWQKIELNESEEKVFAQSALEFNPSSLSAEPERYLRARRRSDLPTTNGTRDLWRTYNVIQENFVRGGLLAKNAQGNYSHTRAVKSIDANLSVNKALWMLTAKMAELKQNQS